MGERVIAARERWLAEAISATQAHVEAERSENAWDLDNAAPDSFDYAMAVDSEACLKLAESTVAAMAAELAELQRRAELRHGR